MQSSGVVINASRPLGGYGTTSGMERVISGQQAQVRQADGHPNVALKSFPGEGNVLGTIDNGKTVTILAESGEFARVRFNGVEGYVKLRNLVKLTMASQAYTPAGSQAGYMSSQAAGTGGGTGAFFAGSQAVGVAGGAAAAPGRPALRRKSTVSEMAAPTEWIWRGQKFSSLEELEAAVQASAVPGTMRGLSLKEMLAPEHKDRLKVKVKELFHQYAGADKKLQYHEMCSLAAVLAASLHIPQTIFGNLNLMFHRYDFSGDGDLDEEEGVMCIEGMLRAYRDSQDETRLRVATGDVIPIKELQRFYNLAKEIGKGGQGTIYLATDKTTGKEKVVKFYDKSNANMPLDDIIDEFALLTQLDSPKIARTYEIFQDAANIYQISEPYYGGDLTKAVEKATQEGIEITVKWFAAIWKQCCQGLVYLHSKHVMHCDLKEPNVMISGDSNWSAPNVVLIDFGCAKNFGAEARGGGTPGYMPPEVWKHNLWTTKGDTFSLGVMMYRMFTRGRFPFAPINGDGTDINAWREAAVTCVMPPMPAELAQQPQLRDLLTRMLQRSFKGRPTIAAVVKDEFFKSNAVDDHAVLRRGTHKLTEIINGRAGHRKSDLFVGLLADHASKENLAQLEDVAQLFNSLDSDHSGILSKDEFRKGLSGKLAASDIEKLIEGMVDDDGTISYTKFMGHMIAHKKQSTTQMLFQLFQEIDSDRNGTLDFNEIEQMLKRPQVAAAMGGKTARELMDEMDDNKRGRVNWEEFQKYLDTRFHGMQPWTAGEAVEYYSGTHQTWVPTKVTAFNPPSGRVMLECKPGAWLDKSIQDKQIRRPVVG